MNSEKDLSGRVALVTGSGRNIGRAIALALGEAGAAVMINALRSAGDAETVAGEIRAKGSRAAVKLADVSRPDQAADLVKATVETFGRLDILVNNAALRRETEFGAISYEEWRSVLGVILDATFLTSQAALPHLARSDEAAIINIGGLSAHTGAPGRAHVIAAKSGIVGLTRALAHELAPQEITVNCVVPGLIDTARGASASSAPHIPSGHSSLVGRKGTPMEIADLVLFLAGPRGRYLTGQTIHANGGAYLP